MPGPEALESPRSLGGLAVDPRLGRLFYAGGALLCILSLFFLGLTLLRQADRLSAVGAGHVELLPSLIAGLLYGLSLITTACAWPIFLGAGGPAAQLVLIGLASQMGKYIPGNVASYLGRAALARTHSVELAKAASSTIAELAAAVAAGMIVGLGSLWLSDAAANIAGQYRDALLLLAVAGVAVLLWFCRTNGSFVSIVTATGVFALSFLLAGASLGFAAEALGIGTLHLLYAVAAFAFAWVAGFVVLGAPAGLGVREAVLVALLAPVTGPAQALALAVLHRLMTIGVDLLVGLLSASLLFGRFKPRQTQADAKALHSGEYVQRFERAPIERVARLTQRLQFPPNYEIADFGCGTGMLLHALGPRPGAYTGVDFSADFIASANRWARAEGFSNYRFVEAEIIDFCSKNEECFDIATALDFSEHVDTATAVPIFTAIRRSLKPGGALYLHTPNLDFFLERAKDIGLLRQFPEHIAVRNPGQMRDLLIASGFSPDRIEVGFIPHYNVLRHLHPLGSLPMIGRFFRARLLISAHV